MTDVLVKINVLFVKHETRFVETSMSIKRSGRFVDARVSYENLAGLRYYIYYTDTRSRAVYRIDTAIQRDTQKHIGARIRARM